ncbi:hypothetical protein [Burkholderia ubonensis]|nr:hypothetical protein [Burkholderia ubonensis]
MRDSSRVTAEMMFDMISLTCLMIVACIEPLGRAVVVVCTAT